MDDPWVRLDRLTGFLAREQGEIPGDPEALGGGHADDAGDRRIRRRSQPRSRKVCCMAAATAGKVLATRAPSKSHTISRMLFIRAAPSRYTAAQAPVRMDF